MNERKSTWLKTTIIVSDLMVWRLLLYIDSVIEDAYDIAVVGPTDMLLKKTVSLTLKNSSFWIYSICIVFFLLLSFYLTIRFSDNVQKPSFKKKRFIANVIGCIMLLLCLGLGVYDVYHRFH